jgi:enoyl-CoA hydratase
MPAFADDTGQLAPNENEESRMPDPLVLYDTDGNIGLVTLNRPDKLNALSMEVRRELAAALAKADEDAATRVVVLRGAGRSFCVGYDIGGGGNEAWRHDALKFHQRLSHSLALELMPWYMRKPVIASVQGHALGAGCELAMFCDITIAADDAKFGEPETRHSQAGPGFVMPWIIGFKKARELLYLGDMIDAQTARELGMVNRVVPLAELEAATLKFARRMALVAPEALAATKLAINRGADAAGFRNAMQAGIDVVAPLYAATTEIGAEFRERARKDGLPAALKWRKAQFEE